MPPTREHRSIDERRRQLLDATIHVMSEHGVSSATTRAITAQAGLPHGAFHYCFDTKNDLFAALLERELRQSLAAVFHLSDGGTTVIERITQGLTTRLEAVKARPNYELALAELAVMSRRDSELIHLSSWEQSAAIDSLALNLEDWSTHKHLQWVAPPDQIAALLLSLIDGITSTWLKDRDDSRATTSIQLASRAIASLLKGESP